MATNGYSVDIVIPCYQEEVALPRTVPTILEYIRNILNMSDVSARSFRLILVDDGSKDRTWSIIADLAAKNPEVCGVKLSRNYGHQNAMIAGLSNADAEVVITMDADLQDDIATIKGMLLEHQLGCDLVLGVRNDRSSDTAFKRGSANGYYRLLSLMGVPAIANHADYRLMSNRALKALLAHDEVNLFLRGIIPTIGFKTAVIPYVRKTREFGETKYTIPKMLRLAIDGITSFSVAPLRAISVLGILIFVASLLASVWIFTTALFFRESVVPGWASTALPTFFLGGVELLALGIIGEYIGKIYLETKRRPRFIIEELLWK
jgi:glycosyltransferase involved in cell wall biosynthesis